MRVFNVVGGFAFVVSLAANAYFVWVGRVIPKCTTAVSDTKVIYVKGGLLQVSQAERTETFERASDDMILGVKVGRTIARIRVPVTYQFHVELAPQWKALLKDKSFVVVVPPVRPSLPVAFDTGKLESQATGRWSFITGGPLRDELLKSLTKTLEAESVSPAMIQLQRETARKTVQDFVVKWLITQDEWKDARSYPIKVFFADEPIHSMGSLPQPFAGVL